MLYATTKLEINYKGVNGPVITKQVQVYNCTVGKMHVQVSRKGKSSDKVKMGLVAYSCEHQELVENHGASNDKPGPSRDTTTKTNKLMFGRTIARVAPAHQTQAVC